MRLRSTALVVIALLSLLASACRSTPPPPRTAPTAPPVELGATASPRVPDATAPAIRVPTVVRPPMAIPPAGPQLRGVWVHLFDDTLKTRAGIRRMLDRVAAAGANTVIVEVVRRQDAYYSSRVLPRTPDPQLEAGLDVLAEVVDGAEERGLAVHAWVPVLPTYHGAYDGLHAPAGWVHAEHGPTAPEADRWVTRSVTGEWDDHLDPALPEVRAHAAAVAAELASSYDIAAVHLDYLRYPGAQWGYHPRALARFQAETGRTDVPVPRDAQWSDWRRAQTRALLEAVRSAVSATAGVTAAVIAQGAGPPPGGFASSRAYADYFQDWPGWMQDGLVDAVMPMTYFEQVTHGDRFEQWLEFHRSLAAATDRTVAPGVGGWLNPAPDGRSQLARALEGTDGAVIYSYQQDSADGPGGLLGWTPTELWSSPAPPPQLQPVQ